MAGLIHFNDPSKGTPTLLEVDGMTAVKEFTDVFLPNTTFEEQCEGVKNLKIRDDDIIVCAFAKCGTHWTWEILNVLLLGEINKQSKVTRMLEFTPLDQIDALPSPRILNTHHPSHLLPKEIKDKKTKIVYIYRNPKDVAISFYYHVSKALQYIDCYMEDLQGYIKKFPVSDYPYNFFKYVREFKRFLENNPDIPSVTLTYEGLQKYPAENVKKLAKFLGIEKSEEEIKAVVETCSFDNMKKADAELKEDFPSKTDNEGKSSIFRKGKTGDWKNQFTVADSEMYDAIIAKEMKGTGIEFEFE